MEALFALKLSTIHHFLIVRVVRRKHHQPLVDIVALQITIVIIVIVVAIVIVVILYSIEDRKGICNC